MNEKKSLLKKDIEEGFSTQDKEDLELANSDFSDYVILIEEN